MAFLFFIIEIISHVIDSKQDIINIACQVADGKPKESLNVDVESTRIIVKNKLSGICHSLLF